MKDFDSILNRRWDILTFSRLVQFSRRMAKGQKIKGRRKCSACQEVVFFAKLVPSLGRVSFQDTLPDSYQVFRVPI